MICIFTKANDDGLRLKYLFQRVKCVYVLCVKHHGKKMCLRCFLLQILVSSFIYQFKKKKKTIVSCVLIALGSETGRRLNRRDRWKENKNKVDLRKEKKVSKKYVVLLLKKKYPSNLCVYFSLFWLPIQPRHR